MNTSTQLKALIRNLSKEKKIKAEILLRNFMLERLLERIALSNYRNQFILKGGLLIAAYVGVGTRSTMDMDTNIKGFELTKEELTKVINHILGVSVDDGVSMTLNKIENIRDEAEYPGMRISIGAQLDKTNQTLKIDVTTGDEITPKAVEYNYKLLLEDRSISIFAYNLETVLAEKLETILSRGTTSTRMRDYYDVFIIMLLYEDKLCIEVLTKAFEATCRHRSSYNNIKNSGKANFKIISGSEVLLKRWKQYCSKNDYASRVLWADAIKSVDKVLMKIGL